jgi:hypothetical protein
MNSMLAWQAKVTKVEEILKALEQKKVRPGDAAEVLPILSKIHRLLERVNHDVDEEMSAIKVRFNKENMSLATLLSRRRKKWLSQDLEEKVWEHERLKARIAYGLSLIKSIEAQWRKAPIPDRPVQPVPFHQPQASFSLYS